ncbi:hypothetical protein GE09DRAFT_1216048 [Coniochaeta sp. 2T2.1]|nr:hypothetical protein GE09DRAFT_1216048 [Coniochaeta sp. 2T2.1]
MSPILQRRTGDGRVSSNDLAVILFFVGLVVIAGIAGYRRSEREAAVESGGADIGDCGPGCRGEDGGGVEGRDGEGGGDEGSMRREEMEMVVVGQEEEEVRDEAVEEEEMKEVCGGRRWTW